MSQVNSLTLTSTCKSTRRRLLQAIGGISIAAGTMPTATAQTSTLEDTLIFHHKLNNNRDDGKIADATGNGVLGHPSDEFIENKHTNFVEDEERGAVLQFEGRGTDSDGGSYNIHHEDMPDSLSRGDPITVSLWVKPREVDKWYTFLNGAFGCAIGTRRGNVRAHSWNPDTRENDFVVSGDATTHLTTGSWNHVLATVAPGNEARLFIDGELIDTQSVDTEQGYRSQYEANGVGWLGRDNDGAFDARFEGRIDDLRFFVGASASEDDAKRVYENTNSDNGINSGDDEAAGDDTNDNEINSGDDGTTSDSTNSGDNGSVTVEVPGFGIPSSLAALSSAGYIIKRRLTADQSHHPSKDK